ncbi:hypothetical protein Bca4012_058081 [Brassica carinata]
MFTSNQIVLEKSILSVTDSASSTSQGIESKDNELFKSVYQSKNECKRWQSKITRLQKNCISDVRADKHQRKGMDTNGTETGNEMIPEVIEFRYVDLGIKLTHVFQWLVF